MKLRDKVLQLGGGFAQEQDFSTEDLFWGTARNFLAQLRVTIELSLMVSFFV
jgi:hypothetical protein